MFFIPLIDIFFPIGNNTNSSRMCGVLLYVEKVRALRLLCAAESVWEEKVQQLSWCNVSGKSFRLIKYVFFMYKTLICKVHIIYKKKQKNRLT